MTEDPATYEAPFNPDVKAQELCSHSKIKVSEDMINTLSINLDIGQQYGMNCHFVDGCNIYRITCHDENIFECSNVSMLIDFSWAIVFFMETYMEKTNDKEEG